MKTTKREKNIKRILKLAHNEVDFIDFDFNAYKYVVKATDNFLSGWGVADGTKAKTLLFCNDMKQVKTAIPKMKNDGFAYCNWYNLDCESVPLKSENVFTIRIIEHAILWK